MSKRFNETLNVSEARQNFSSLLNRVYKERERIVIEKSGIPVAVLVSVEDLARLQMSDDIRASRKELIENFRRPFADADPDELQREIDRALEEVRAKMRAELETGKLAS